MNASTADITAMNYISQRVARGIHLLYILLVRPKARDEDSIRREFILNILLLGSLALLTASDAVILYHSITQGGAYENIPFGIFSLLVLFCMGIYVLSRLGYWRLSSYVLIAIFLVGSAYGGHRWGEDLPIVLLSYAFAIVMASILLGTGSGFLVTGIAIAITVISGYSELHGLTIPDQSWKGSLFDGGDAVEYAVILFLIMIVSWLANREIEKSLHRARRSESALKEQNDMLEITVERRTRELRDAEAAQMGQVYRFAEFGKLASGFFHDIMTPLTSMSLHIAEFRATDDREILETKKRMGSVLDAAARMERFIHSVRKQLRSNEISELFALGDVVREVIEVLDYKIKKSEVEVVRREREHISHYGNPIKLHQVVLNLVSNAIDASSRGKQVCVTTEKEGGYVVVLVEDAGSGIPVESLSKIFEPFFTTKSGDDGIGIGLSFTRSIVEESFQGTIIAENTGHGARFTVRFPLVSQA